MKVIVVGSTYIKDETQMELVRLSYKAFRVVNPDIPFMLLDSASPFDPKSFLPSDVEIKRFETNVGHLSQGGRDGAGRSFCESMKIAFDRGYDYVVCWEPDVLFAKPIMDVIRSMDKAGIKAVALPQPQYNFPEFGVAFFNVKFLNEINFVAKYDWENSPKWPIPEMRVFNILGDNLWLLPVNGIRNDQGQLNSNNFANAWPYGPPSWLTHCYRDFNLYYQFLSANNIKVV